MGALEGKVVIITGAGHGIGLATARRFGREGARLILAGRHAEPLHEAVAAIGRDRASHVVADVSQPDHSEQLVRVAVERHGGLDVYISNAGVVGVSAPLAEYPVEAFDQVMAVNVRGVFLGLKHAIPALRARGGGSIVILSSIAGIKARGNVAYVASKHAELGLMRTAAMECTPHRIRVNCVLPGPTDTRMMRAIEQGRSPGAPERAHAEIVAGLPLGRYGTPDEIAELVLFLASDASSICTGGVYMADGGLSAF